MVKIQNLVVNQELQPIKLNFVLLVETIPTRFFLIGIHSMQLGMLTEKSWNLSE